MKCKEVVRVKIYHLCLLRNSEQYLKSKSAAQVATPVRAELEKIRNGCHPASSPSTIVPGMASYRPGNQTILSFSPSCPIEERRNIFFITFSYSLSLSCS